jgi:hypothetical protein
VQTSEQNLYDQLDMAALMTVLLNPEQPAKIHRAALSALSRRGAFDRASGAVQLLKSMVKNPGRYDQEVMITVIDILATDPTPDATYAMLEAVPDVLNAGVDGTDILAVDFREYFYTALVTRQREGDLQVWAEILPQLDGKSLVACLIDPAAKPLLDAIEPLVLIDRIAEPSRTKALMSAIAGISARKGNPTIVQDAIKLIQQSSDSEQLKQGIEVLVQQWEKAKAAGREGQMGILEAALRMLDNKPRSPGERLTGKRPWAP